MLRKLRLIAFLAVTIAGCTEMMKPAVVDPPTGPDAGRPAIDGAAIEDAHFYSYPATLSDPSSIHHAAPIAYPSGEAPHSGWPLVIALHGYNHTGSDALTQVGMPDAPSWAVTVTPTGMFDSTGAPFWNASPACCDRDHLAPDDIAYIGTLIDEAQVGAPIDPAAIYIVGQSNGGFLAESVACSNSDVIAAIDVSGAVPPTCAHAPALLRAHGTDDPTIAYVGGQMTGLAPYVGAEDVQTVGCQALGAFGSDHYDYDLAINGMESQVALGVGCATEVVRMYGSKHQPRLSTAWEGFARAWLGAH